MTALLLILLGMPPMATLTVTPRSARAPVKVRCEVAVDHPGFVMPEVSWAWARNSVQAGYAVSFSERRTFVFRRPGAYVIAACMKGEPGIACDWKSVEVRP